MRGTFLALALACAPLAAAGDTAMEQALDKAHAAGKLEGLHAVYVLRGGAVFAERYYPGKDEYWGMDRGVVPHGPDDPHDLRSVTKSITGLLYGIALAEGLVPPPDAPLHAHLPDQAAHFEADPRKRAITVRHVLTMTMGLEWDESGTIEQGRMDEIAMERAADRIGFVLSRPVAEAPGTRWRYSGGATAILAELIRRGTGKHVGAYAEEKLFAPLGIVNWGWSGRTAEEPAAASGLAMTARDLGRIGLMIAADGMWEGRRIVPADWLAESFSRHVEIGELAYGYQWYMPNMEDPPWVAGFGNGGQRFSINRGRGLVFVAYAGLYWNPEAWRLPLTVSMDFLGPALEAAEGR